MDKTSLKCSETCEHLQHEDHVIQSKAPEQILNNVFLYYLAVVIPGFHPGGTSMGGSLYGRALFLPQSKHIGQISCQGTGFELQLVPRCYTMAARFT